MPGFSSKRRLPLSLAAVMSLSLAAALSAPAAVAQDAPVIGGHYAARASDTGFAGAVNSSGGYGASVPLDLPPVRGGLPLPLSVVYGGNQFGAAGLGWSVPLSSIRRALTIAHRRPANIADASLQPREQLSLTLNGSDTDLIRNGADTAWLARRGNAQLEVREVGGGVLEMTDGSGLRYSFSSDGHSSDGSDVGSLDNGNLYLLRDIFGPGGANVHLDYQFGRPALAVTGLSINLASMRYNPDSTGACAKHQINLVYDDPGQALSLSVLNSAVLARVNKLVAIDVTARESATDSPQPCAGAMKSLRTYNLSYQADPDTGQPRLHQVTMIGQQDTPERNVTLPVTTFAYGRFTDSDGAISYVQAQQPVSLPANYTNHSIAETVTAQNPHFAAVSSTLTSNGLIDLNGDGRPDLTAATFTGYWRNRPSPFGMSFSDQNSIVLPQLDETGHTHVPGPISGGDLVQYGVAANRSYVDKQLIDMNGDGRLDIVDSDVQGQENVWVVYLNTPDPADPNHTIWVPRTISILPMVRHLVEAGLLLDGVNDITGTPVTDPSQVKRLPLRRSFTSNLVKFHHCYHWTGTGWEPSLVGYSGDCAFPQFQDPSAPHYGGEATEGQTSFVEWELKDINGDGYPDLVYNASPVLAQLVGGEAPSQPPRSGVFYEQSDATWSPVFTGSHAVKALINVAGVHLDQATSAFSSPIVLVADSAGCGIEKWVPGFGGTGRSNQLCGFADVNGDGLVDRLRSFDGSDGLRGLADLGTGNMDAPFGGPRINLPGPLAQTQRKVIQISDDKGTHFGPPPDVCGPIANHDKYPVQRTAAMRDVNGDGIPDYILGTVNATTGDPASTRWTVAFGTGTGFSDHVQVRGDAGMELSLELVDCKGRLNDTSVAATTRGFYDIDGDGQPDVVVYDPFAQSFQVYQHVRRDAGRLIQIGNGYGASTNIQYSSANEDASTNHLLPYSEIVVGSVTSTDDQQNLLAQPALYAYGGAVQFFDSAKDRWVFPGYQRNVAMQYAALAVLDGNATITDSYPLAEPFNPALDATGRFLRYAKTGRVSDVTRLSGNMGNDVWRLLSSNVSSDERRIAATHSDYSARLLPVGKTGNEFCVDMVYPHDYGQSLAYKTAHADSQDQCAAHGFTLQNSVTSWRGAPGTAPGTADTITSPSIVQTSAAVNAFDDLGRVVQSTRHTDIAGSANDLCTKTFIEYATPAPNTTVRVLNAPATQTVTSCTEQGHAPLTFAKKRLEYDGLALTPDSPTQQVSNGFVTSSIVTRYDMDTHASLGDDIRLFDASYDAAGNVQSVRRVRAEDHATKTDHFSYDAFGLVKTGFTSDADGTRQLTGSAAYDPVTLNVTSTTDANGTVRGNSFDGLGRVVLSKITPPGGGSEGVLSWLSYSGFELVDTNNDGIPDSTSTAGRSIAQKVFTDAVPEANVATAPGRIGTTFLDNLGRPIKTAAQLGADYSNKTLILGQRKYDLFGRVQFMADPFLFLSTDSFATAYGTSFNYNTDGTPSCSIRGNGPLPATANLDESNEVFPTCFNRSFNDNQAFLQRFDPSSGSATKEIAVNAVGRVLQRSAYRTVHGGAHGGHNVLFERMAFGYDALGHMTSMTRDQDAANQANPVTTIRHFDSLGWMSKLEEPGVAPQTSTFDSWGEITQVQWCDDLSAAPCPTKDRRSITRFDARGRPLHKEDQVAGQTVPETVNDYSYDSSGIAVQFVPRNNTLGRLASATWPTGQEWFTYDDFGRVNARVFVDTTVPAPHPHHYEIHETYDDGSEKILHLQLQDTNKEDERVNYGYDSAGRIKSAVYNYHGASQTLFAASGTSPIYDDFGRITAAQYGLASYNATYAANGRRLLNDAKVTSGDLAHSREIAFPVLNGVTPFDPMGRERQRREFIDGAGPIALLRSYDPLGQLSASQNLQVATNTTQDDRAFTYDPLGNVLTQTDSNTGNPGSVSLTYGAPDLDRICGLAYGGATAPQAPACNVAYDGAGNTLSEPTRSGTRAFTCFPSGQVKTIASGSTNATYNYDAFGAVQQLTLNTPAADMRQDKYFGGFVKQRIEGSQSVFTRQIPAPGLTATRHGPTGGWTFAFGENRGTRFATDQTGAFVQGIDYQPFGEVKNPTGGTPGNTNYTSDQFNGGDLLAAFGVVQLGARIYDPVIGRFLSRDPIISARSPYAFAANDPVNKIDPTGLSDVIPTKGGTVDVDPQTTKPEPLPPPPPVPQAYDYENPLARLPIPAPAPEESPSLLERGIHTYGGVVGAAPHGVIQKALAALRFVQEAEDIPLDWLIGKHPTSMVAAAGSQPMDPKEVKRDYKLMLMVASLAAGVGEVAELGVAALEYVGAEEGAELVSGGSEIVSVASVARVASSGKITTYATANGGAIISVGNVEAAAYSSIHRALARGEILVDAHGSAVNGVLTGMPAEASVGEIVGSVRQAMGYMRSQGIAPTGVTLAVCGGGCPGGLAAAVRAGTGLPTSASAGVTSLLDMLGGGGTPVP